MKYLGYKFLLSLLKIVVYLKRGVFWLGRGIFSIGKSLQGIFEKTLGFRLYKIQFFLKKRFDRSKNPWTMPVIDFFGRRSTLQVVLLFVFIIIMYPHSSLYTEDSLGLPGRKTVLYQLLGPGDQDFQETEEVDADTIILPGANWRAGSIAYDNINVNNQVPEATGISGVGPGGMALIKPNILPGANLPSSSEPAASVSNRQGIVNYTVQNGDVIGGIATKFGVSVNTILWANNLTARSYIRPGDVLQIPPGTGVMYVVKKGDTLGKIARQYDVQTEEIALANNLNKNGSNLTVGKSIFVPGGQPIVSAPLNSRVIVRETGTIGKELEKVAAPVPSITAPAGSGYIWPTMDHRINQYFGIRHTGVDIAGKIGNSNYAAKAGKVIKSQCGWNGGYGCYIILDHGGGVTTLYGHNSKLLVSVGETVEQGQVIGLLGSTGRSTGPHLHFEVRVGGARVNPLKYVR